MFEIKIPKDKLGVCIVQESKASLEWLWLMGWFWL